MWIYFLENIKLLHEDLLYLRSRSKNEIEINTIKTSLIEKEHQILSYLSVLVTSVKANFYKVKNSFRNELFGLGVVEISFFLNKHFTEVIEQSTVYETFIMFMKLYMLQLRFIQPCQ